MEIMYSYGSSFEPNLTLQSSNSFRDVSFSSYLNKAEENMIRELTNQPSQLPNSEDEKEIGVFGAEKYFQWEPEDHNTNEKLHQQVEEFDQTSTCTPSVRSNASCKSRSEFFPNRSKTISFLARFGSNCVNKKSIQINENNAKEIISKPHSSTSMQDFEQISDQLSSSKTVETTTRNDYFSFPVLISNDLNSSSNSKSGELAGKKVSLLNDDWDMEIGTEDEMYISSSRMYNNDDVDSDSSSDLFEIGTFSATGNSSRRLGHMKSDSNCYAPSEVSVDWSVVTASAADFSVVSDYDDVWTGGGGGGWRSSGGKSQVRGKKEKRKKRSGFLSGCTSYNAVRVAGDEYKVSGGGAGGRRRLPDSMAIGSMFRGGII